MIPGFHYILSGYTRVSRLDSVMNPNMWLTFDPDVTRVELHFITSATSALFWIEPGHNSRVVRNGSASFLECGSRTFAVTAAHVIDEWRKASMELGAGHLQLAGVRESISLDAESRIIDQHCKMDIATFEVSRSEVESIGKTVFVGGQEDWPPPSPQKDQGIILSGYPGAITRVDSQAITFSAAPAGLSATSISETDIICQVERDKLAGVIARGIPPENFNFGGISGAAMLAQVITRGGLLSWTLAGVVYEGPSTVPNESIAGFELIRGRLAHFIKSDGTLDRIRWANADFLNR